MSFNNSTGFNSVKTQRLMSLTCLINPEKDKSFEYLCKFLKYTKVESLKILSQITIEDLIKQEKIYHDMILNPTEHNVSGLNSWINYILWIKKLFTKYDLRFFLILENFTKSTASDKECFSHTEFVEQWIAYVDMCADDLEVMKYMKKNDICTKNNFFYQSMAILFEKSHDFQNANTAYLEGFDKKVENLENLQASYKLFEERMENRINREINSSVFSSEIINSYIHNEMKKVTQNFHDNAIYNSNNKRLRNFSSNESISNINFVIKKKKIEFLDENVGQEGIHSTIKYGQVPIYVDEPFRKNVITKGTKLVEVYSILVKFLLERDEMFKIQNVNFNKKLKEDYHKKPVSWLNGMRINPEKISKGDEFLTMMTNLEYVGDVSASAINKNTSSSYPVNKDKQDDKIRIDARQKILPDNEKEKDQKIENDNNIKKVEDVMNKMIQDVKGKMDSVNIDTKQKDTYISQNADKPKINITKEKDGISQNLHEKKPIEPSIIQDVPSQSAETFQLQDGSKYRILRVEHQSKKEMEIVMAKQRAFNQNKKEYCTLEQIRAQKYFENLRIKEKNELDMKNKRKTIIFKIDSDGDMCLSSDEEGEILPRLINIPQPNHTVKPKPNMAKEYEVIQADNKQAIKVNAGGNTSININTIKNEKSVGPNLLQNSNLNLFDYAMTIEEINEKIKEVTNMFTKGLINLPTRDILYNHLEEKIIQIEKLENEQLISKKLKVASFNDLQSEEKGNSSNVNNPFLNQNKIISKEKFDYDLFTYLEPINSKSKIPAANPNNRNRGGMNNLNIPNPLINPLMELPNSILKKPADETAFSNVSRSLDFTNIKLIDSTVKTNESKVPFSSMFILDNKNKQQKKEDFSISFDSEHSFMFPNAFDTNPINEENFFSDRTPTKEDHKHFQKTFNIRDTPQLIKKNYLEEDFIIKEENLKIHSINHINNINLQLINNNNSLKINEDKKFTDLNDILKDGNKKFMNNLITDSEEENESEVEKKKKLAKLFGDAFGINKKQELPSLNYPYGLSSITEKTTENTYLSDDSVILRKMI